jgi:uncharacterized DUF497 family protein
MRIEWDEDKRQRNIEKHDFDFLDARLMFDGRPKVTGRSNYPHEARFLTTGLIFGLMYTVVWTQRDDAIWIISARRARDAEKRAYRELHNGRT